MATTLNFVCSCGREIAVGSESQGKVVVCPECSRTMRAPRVAKKSGQTVIRMTCQACGKRFSVPLEMTGAPTACPHCSERGEAPRLAHGEGTAAPGDATSAAEAVSASSTKPAPPSPHGEAEEIPVLVTCDEEEDVPVLEEVGAPMVQVAPGAPAVPAGNKGVRAILIVGLVLLCLMGAALAGMTTNWFGLARERLTVDCRAQPIETREDPGARVDIMIRNVGSRPATLTPGKEAGEKGYALALERRTDKGEWVDTSRVLGLRRGGAGSWSAPSGASLPQVLAPDQECTVAAVLSPVYDYTAPGSDAIPRKPVTMAGTYRILLRHRNASRQVVREFEVRGVQHPLATAAATFRQANEAEKEGRLEQAAALYAKLAGTPYSRQAATARRKVESLLTQTKQRERAGKALEDAKAVEEKGDLRGAIKILRAGRPEGSGFGAKPEEVQKIEARIAQLESKLRQAESQAASADIQRVKSLIERRQFSEACSLCEAIQRKYDGFPQAAEAGQLHEQADRLRTEAAVKARTTPLFAKVDELIADGDAIAAHYALWEYQNNPDNLGAVEAKIRRALAAACAEKSKEVETAIGKIICNRRAEMYEAFAGRYAREQRYGHAHVQEDCRRKAGECRQREAEAKALALRVTKVGRGGRLWVTYVGRILNEYSDTSTAAGYLQKGMGRQYEYYKKHTRGR